MRAVIQRVSQAKVTISGDQIGSIGKGFVVLLGVGKNDTEKDCDYLAEKIAHSRIFPDDQDKMNHSLLDVGGSVLVVSQFTLYGDCRKGRRPSYNDAALPKNAKRLYDYFVNKIQTMGVNVATGQFKSMMNIQLTNDGPVTILLDSNKAF